MEASTLQEAAYWAQACAWGLLAVISVTALTVYLNTTKRNRSNDKW